MVLATQPLGWFRQLGHLVGGGKLEKRDAAGTAQCAFELADAMEQGIALEGLATGFLTPLEGEKTQRLVVSRSEDRTEFKLASEDGDTLLIARGRREGKKLDFYIPTGGDPPLAVGPTFTLEAEDADRQSWALTERCDCCAYRRCAKVHRRELLRIRHSRQKIGEGSAMCMEVAMPPLNANDTPPAWCEQDSGERREVRLVSKRPRWSARLASLTLDFRGRCSKASAKNFQLQVEEAPADKAREPELLFGKTGDNSFVLDYRRPLGMAQAFAIALSTKEWH